MNRVLLLTTPNTYRAQAFLAAAERLGVEVVIAIDMQAELAESWGQQLGLDFQHIEQAVAAIVALAAERPLNAIIAVDDSGSLLAARAGVPSPAFQRYSTGDDLHALAEQVAYPCVVKPLRLNGSRGVIRANNPR